MPMTAEATIRFLDIGWFLTSEAVDPEVATHTSARDQPSPCRDSRRVWTHFCSVSVSRLLTKYSTPSATVADQRRTLTGFPNALLCVAPFETNRVGSALATDVSSPTVRPERWTGL